MKNKISTLGIIAFVVFLVYFIFLIRKDIIDNRGLNKECQKLSQKLEEEGGRGDRLRSRLKRIKNGDLVEELARTRLEMIKKGEVAYKVILDK